MKKQYMKPSMQIVELKQRTMILTMSEQHGMNCNLQSEEVNEAW